MDAGRVRIGVIGVGGLAQSCHLPALKMIDGIERVAACDIIPGKADIAVERFGFGKSYVLYREMLAKEKLDAVFVLVEPHNLFEVVRDCLGAGVDVFMEKPPGVTAFQAEALMRKAESVDRILQVGFNRRYIPVVQRTWEIMKDVTPITQVEGCFFKNGPASFFEGSISSFPSDTIHAVDLLRWFAGGKAIKAATIQGQVEDVVPNSWNSVIAFDNGVTGILKANYKTGGRVHTFEIHGPKASAFINLGFGDATAKADILVHGGAPIYSVASQGGRAHDHIHLDGLELAGSEEFFQYYGFLQEDRAFIESVRTRSEPLVGISEGVESIRLVEMLLGSIIHKSGC